MEKYLKADRIIRTLIQEGRTEFAIYPFGEFGMLVKDILNKRYGITEKYIIDNKLGKYSLNKTIITLDEFVLNKENNITILLSSDGAGYTEIRYELLKRVDISKVIDVFSYSMYFDKNVYYDLANYEHPRVSALESAAREIYRNNVVGAVNVEYIKENLATILAACSQIESYICLIHFQALMQEILQSRRKWIPENFAV